MFDGAKSRQHSVQGVGHALARHEALINVALASDRLIVSVEGYDVAREDAPSK